MDVPITDFKSSIVISLSIISFYLIPFFILEFNKNIKLVIEHIYSFKKTYLVLMILLIYFFITFNYMGSIGGGFFAKLYIFMSVLEQEMYSLAIIGLLTTVISAFYYLKIIKTIYFEDNKSSFDNVKSILFIVLIIYIFYTSSLLYSFLKFV